MTRREALSRSAILLGGAVSAPVLAAVMQGCKTGPDLPQLSTFLTPGQEKMVTVMVDLILPKTSTPGAVEAGVPAFIYAVMQDCFSKEERAAFVAGLDQLDEDCKAAQGRRFLKLAAGKQVSFLKKTDQEARQAEQGSDKPTPPQATWRRLKELTLVGYFTSEAGATEALEYIPIPGRLETCTDMPQEQRAWAV